MDLLISVCNALWAFADWALPVAADDFDKAAFLAIPIGALLIWAGITIVDNFRNLVERLALYRAARRLSLRPKQQALFLAGVYRR